jgi:hypothetical protein
MDRAERDAARQPDIGLEIPEALDDGLHRRIASGAGRAQLGEGIEGDGAAGDLDRTRVDRQRLGEGGRDRQDADRTRAGTRGTETSPRAR